MLIISQRLEVFPSRCFAGCLVIVESYMPNEQIL